MKMKLFVNTILICVLSSMSYAQQLPVFSQYSYNRAAFNPAYAGNINRVEAILTHRNHLMSFPGAPTTQQVVITAPWQQKYMGFGLRILNDNIGASGHFSMNAAANYSLRLGEGKLSMGLELGFDQYSVKWDELVIHDLGDENIPNAKASATSPNASFGLFYTTEHWYVGYSVQNMMGSKISFTDAESENPGKQYAHHYINAGGVKKLNDNFQIEPFLLLKATAGAPMQMDIGTYGVFKEKYGLGLAYRTADALIVTAKIQLLEKIYLGYSYEARMSDMSQYSSSSHELMIGYFHKLLAPARKKVIHPRYYF